MSEQTATDERHTDPRLTVWQQVTALYGSLSTTQRVSVGVAAIVLGAGFTWLMMNRSSTDVVPVLNGRAFARDELVAARKQLATAGLKGFQVVDGRILAPATDAARYDAALSALESEGTGWAGAWQEANASLSPFATARQQHDAQEIARARLISQLLAQLPDVAQAEIVWDEEPRIGWRQPPKVRATVYLQPRPHREITRDIVAAVKQSVAGSKAHLDPDDIVVLDLERMVAYGPRTGTDETTLEQQRKAKKTQANRQRIEDALTDIEGVRVAVVVEPARVGVPSEPPAIPGQGGSQPSRETPLRSPETPAPRPITPAGGPNLKLEVPRFADEPAPVISPERSSNVTVASHPDARPAATGEATPDRVTVTVSLAPDYLQRQTELHHGREAFIRMSATQQQALLADTARVVARNVRERIAAIIPGETVDDRMARVQIIPELTSVAGSGEVAPGAAAAELASTSGTIRSARWVILGMIVCLTVWMVYQIARAIRSWRREPSRSRDERQSPLQVSVSNFDPHPADHTGHPLAADGPARLMMESAQSAPQRVADLLAAMDHDDAAEWLHNVGGESPQVVTALLRRLPPERVADVLAALSADVQGEVLAHLAGMDSSPAVPVIEPVRRRSTAPYGEQRTSPSMPRRRGWFQRWRTGRSNASEAHWRQSETLPIEDASDLDQITELDPVALRSRYAELSVETWSTALMGASSAFRVRLLSALPAGDAAELRQALTRHRPARLDDIESAQSRVLALLNGHSVSAIESR